MKKIINKIVGLSFLLVVLYACNEDPDIWDSSTVAFDGNWYVSYDHEEYGEDPFEYGFTPLYTYNTADNDGQEIWITDDGNFYWDYKVRIPVNQSDVTFGSDQEVNNISIKIITDTIPVADGETDYLITPDTIKTNDGKADSLIILYRYHQAKLMNGQIIPNSVSLPSGAIADSIYFEIWFEDLIDATEIENDKLIVSGYRQTGFPEDEH